MDDFFRTAMNEQEEALAKQLGAEKLFIDWGNPLYRKTSMVAFINVQDKTLVHGVVSARLSDIAGCYEQLKKWAKEARK